MGRPYFHATVLRYSSKSLSILGDGAAGIEGKFKLGDLQYWF